MKLHHTELSLWCGVLTFNRLGHTGELRNPYKSLFRKKKQISYIKKIIEIVLFISNIRLFCHYFEKLSKIIFSTSCYFLYVWHIFSFLSYIYTRKLPPLLYYDSNNNNFSRYIIIYISSSRYTYVLFFFYLFLILISLIFFFSSMFLNLAILFLRFFSTHYISCTRKWSRSSQNKPIAKFTAWTPWIFVEYFRCRLLKHATIISETISFFFIFIQFFFFSQLCKQCLYFIPQILCIRQTLDMVYRYSCQKFCFQNKTP